MTNAASHNAPTTSPALAALLHEIIDYAGLFPPAKLDMATTVRNYARDKSTPDAWMLSRIIVPTDRLEAFEREARDLLPTDADDAPWCLSGLTAPAGDERLAGHLDRILDFNRRHEEEGAGLARIDVIELRGDNADDIDAALDRVPDEIYPFFELPIDTDPRGLIAAIVGSDAGAKVRTGGVTADLHPSPPDLARFIVACAAAQVPFKATAGLHHPLRHYADAVQTRQFGFLNVFVGAALAHAARIDVQELTELLEDEDVASFAFDDDGMGWSGHRVSLDQITRSRNLLAISFGSCSFDEPREDLRALGLMESDEATEGR